MGQDRPKVGMANADVVALLVKLIDSQALIIAKLYRPPWWKRLLLFLRRRANA